MPEHDDARVADVPATSDADLVLRTRSGDTDAFGELWSRHYRSGITAARSITTSIDADDLVQEAFAKIFQTVRRGGGPTGSFRAYLFTAIRNTAATWGRARNEIAIDGFEDLIEDPESTDEAAEAALDRGLTHQAFRSLPTRWQEVLWYSEIEQMKPREIAPLFGMKASAVSQLAARAREGLREAWIQAHLASVEDGSEHQWVIERLAAHTRGSLGARDRRKVDAHLADCARCAIVAAEARQVGSRLALILLPLALGVPAAGGYLAAVQRGEEALVALAAMPSEVVGGAVVAGGAAAGGAGAAAGSSQAGGAGAAGGSAAWTVGGVLTATLATAAVAGAVIIASIAQNPSLPSAASNSFADGSLPSSAQVEPSDDLADQEAPDETAPDEDEDDDLRTAIGVAGAQVLDADARTVAVDVTGEPGSRVLLRTDEGVHALGGSGSTGDPAMSARPAAAGSAVSDATVSRGGSARLVIALTAQQVRDDARLSVVYADEADAPVRASLSQLGVRPALLAALGVERDEPEADEAVDEDEVRVAAPDQRDSSEDPVPGDERPRPGAPDGAAEDDASDADARPADEIEDEDPAPGEDDGSESGESTADAGDDGAGEDSDAGGESADDAEAPSPEPVAPAAPEPVAVSAADGGVRIEWVAVDDAETYRVWREDPSGEVVALGETAETVWVDETDLEPGVYSYLVSAVASGLESERTTVGAIEIADAAPEVTHADKNHYGGYTLTIVGEPGARVRVSFGLFGWTTDETLVDGTAIVETASLLPGTPVRVAYLYEDDRPGKAREYSRADLDALS
ncbi:sigma-70 family RNA polymerase sigma factor [Microbacterium sp. gxy059]|uniref:sigma-70 family RNA polymerase sigma factor n=1 Tax=Microbacterium sp. gxy059 TaxID=2957199 RepID=UPI003D992DBF